MLTHEQRWWDRSHHLQRPGRNWLPCMPEPLLPWNYLWSFLNPRCHWRRKKRLEEEALEWPRFEPNSDWGRDELDPDRQQTKTAAWAMVMDENSCQPTAVWGLQKKAEFLFRKQRNFYFVQLCEVYINFVPCPPLMVNLWKFSTILLCIQEQVCMVWSLPASPPSSLASTGSRERIAKVDSQCVSNISVLWFLCI